MAREIQSMPEIYTGGISADGLTREESLRVRVVFQGGDPDGEWYVFGTDPEPTLPEPVRAFQAVHFPAAFDSMVEGESILYDNAIQALRGMLEA